MLAIIVASSASQSLTFAGCRYTHTHTHIPPHFSEKPHSAGPHYDATTADVYFGAYCLLTVQTAKAHTHFTNHTQRANPNPSSYDQKMKRYKEPVVCGLALDMVNNLCLFVL